MYQKGQQGFTLIELMIALAIFMILLAYGMPNYHQFKQNKIMTEEINRLVRTINFARNQSINSGGHIILCASQSMTACDSGSDWHAGWMVFADNNRNRQFDSTDLMLLNENPMNHQINAISSQFRQKIRFDQMGATPGTNLTIRFCDGRGEAHGKAIIVSNVGRPRLLQSVDRCG